MIDPRFFTIPKFHSVHNFLNEKGIFCMEMKKTKDIIFDEDIRIKKYGNTQVAIWQIN